ncbi:MAG: dTMP kinase [bacterium]
MFIMLDGIDGSGKSTVMRAWKSHLANSGNAVFDLQKYWQEKKQYPKLEETRAYDFILSCEPTYCGVGSVIRDELIAKNTNYPPIAIAQAYSLDRLVLYNRIIVPLLKQDKFIIQDRGISSSLVYQPLHDPTLTMNAVCDLLGNQLALKHCPEHLVIMDIDPEEAGARLMARSDKNDDSLFEKIEFQKKLAEKFMSDDFKSIFESRGCKIHYLSANVKIDIMNNNAITFLRDIINT